MSGPSPKERRALPEREAFPEVFFCFPPIDVPGFLSGTVSVVFDRSGRTGSMRVVLPSISLRTCGSRCT